MHHGGSVGGGGARVMNVMAPLLLDYPHQKLHPPTIIGRGCQYRHMVGGI